MFLQSYIYWQSLTVQAMPNLVSQLKDSDAEDILWKGSEYLCSDLQQYTDLLLQSTHPSLQLPKIAQFHKALEAMAAICSEFPKCRMEEMLKLCAAPVVSEAVDLMGKMSWGEGINSDVLLGPDDGYVSGMNNRGDCVKTVTYPHFALAFYTQEERDVLASATLNVHNKNAERKQNTLEDARFKWLSAQRVRISLRDAQPLDVQMLYPAGPYAPWQVWHYWSFLYDSNNNRPKISSGKGKGKLSMMSLA